MSKQSEVILTRLEMTNFKRFYGTHALDLGPKPDAGQSIILVGGDNGRGKTSIHEAINYALYEDDELPGINTRPTYIQAVSDRLNRRALDEGASEYGVTLEFVVTDGGPPRQFRLERRWDVNVNQRQVQRVELAILENGRTVDWVDPNDSFAIRQFVRGVFPPRIAPFFFFDGERIQEFAESYSHEDQFVNAVEDILHINVYRRLREDLGKYVADYVEREEVRKKDAGDYFKLQEDAERIQEELEEKTARKDDVAREIDDLTIERNRIADELRRVASPHAPKREALLIEQERLERELVQVKGEIERNFALIPIGVAGDLRHRLSETLQREAAGVRTVAGVAELRRRLQEVAEAVIVRPLPPPPEGVVLSQPQKDWLSARYKAATESIFELQDQAKGRRLHDIGEGERQQILQRLGQIGRAARSLRDSIDRRERLTQEKEDVDHKLATTTDDPAIAQLIQKKQEADERLGELESQKTALQADIERLQADLAARVRQIEDRQRDRDAATEAKRVVRMARRGQSALDDFIKALHPEKLHSLQSKFNEMYQRIRKDEDPVQSIEVDPQTWNVILKDHRGRALERRVFSAGMKEMFALSLLWALAQASGRKLPIVIDTPLGRLDSKNRAALCQHYFPYAGHQVVVLSTDKEVDQEWFGVLRPYVARQYTLDYEATTESTIIRPGYFF